MGNYFLSMCRYSWQLINQEDISETLLSGLLSHFCFPSQPPPWSPNEDDTFGCQRAHMRQPSRTSSTGPFTHP